MSSRAQKFLIITVFQVLLTCGHSVFCCTVPYHPGRVPCVSDHRTSKHQTKTVVNQVTYSGSVKFVNRLTGYGKYTTAACQPVPGVYLIWYQCVQGIFKGSL